ncbi:MAG: hypothetical protein ABL918_05640 [Chakrabartia sp.]
MTEGNARFEGRRIGGLIIAATAGAIVLMFHHPTSINGVDDGLLLHDWSNALVHSTMMVCLFTLMFAFAVFARRLGGEHLAVRAGAMAFSSGMTAFIAASFINGFVVGGLHAALIDPAGAASQYTMLAVLNQKLALLGITLTSVAMALWALRLVQLDGLTKMAGGLGIAMALLAGYWLLTGGGAFGLYSATVSVFTFSIWSLILATQLIKGRL